MRLWPPRWNRRIYRGESYAVGPSTEAIAAVSIRSHSIVGVGLVAWVHVAYRLKKRAYHRLVQFSCSWALGFSQSTPL